MGFLFSLHYVRNKLFHILKMCCPLKSDISKIALVNFIFLSSYKPLLNKSTFVGQDVHHILMKINTALP